MKTICSIVAALALGALMFAEGDTFTSSLIIKGVSILILAVCGEILEKKFKKVNGRA